MRRIWQAYHRGNTWIADHLSVWMITMEAFWILVVLTWGSVVISRPAGAQGWDLFLVSIFFQGAALPILGLVSQKQGDRMERVMRETHDAAMEEVGLLRSEIADIKAIREEEAEELALLRQMVAPKEGIGDG